MSHSLETVVERTPIKQLSSEPLVRQAVIRCKGCGQMLAENPSAAFWLGWHLEASESCVEGYVDFVRMTRFGGALHCPADLWRLAIRETVHVCKIQANHWEIRGVTPSGEACCFEITATYKAAERWLAERLNGTG